VPSKKKHVLILPSVYLVVNDGKKIIGRVRLSVCFKESGGRCSLSSRKRKDSGDRRGVRLLFRKENESSSFQGQRKAKLFSLWEIREGLS